MNCMKYICHGSDEAFDLTNVFSDHLAEVIITGKTGEDTLAVTVMHLLKREICRQDRRTLVYVTFFDEMVELGIGEVIGQLCAQIIDDQQITLQQILNLLHILMRLPVFAEDLQF